MSTTETEYAPASEAIKDLIWIKRLFNGIVFSKYLAKPTMVMTEGEVIEDIAVAMFVPRVIEPASVVELLKYGY